MKVLLIDDDPDILDAVTVGFHFEWRDCTVLTARQTEANHVRGLDLGADDYVTKPFTILTLLARIRAILRRAESRMGSAESRAVAFGELMIDLRDQQVWVRGTRVHVTPAEYRLLYHLARNPNRVISNRVLCERVWGPDWQATANDLKALVHRLRAKLGDNPREPRYIENQRGMGYRFVARPEPAALPHE